MNKGILLILAGYIGWGLFPLYWALLKDVGAYEVLAHRMLWSVPVLLLFVSLKYSWRKSFSTTIKNPKELVWLLLTALLITVNWGLYIVAVNSDRVVEASMGYFLSPLLNVLGGFLVFKEQISRLKQLALLFATIGVFYYILSVDHLPWLGLIIGFSFAAYGVLRKYIQTEAVPGLLVETLLLIPLSLGFILYLAIHKQASFLNSEGLITFWLILAGLVTVVPLVLFTSGARLLPMTTTGILFYITPTMQFLVGVVIFNEAINPHQLIGFVGIWIGLALYAIALIKDN